MPLSEIRSISANLVQAMRFFGTARRNGEIHDFPGMCVVTCGINYAAFNASILCAPIGADLATLNQQIQISAKHFDTRQLRWTYWYCDDHLEKPLRREARTIFGRFGLSPLTEAAGMFAERLRPPSRKLPVLRVRRVCDSQTRLDFAHVTSLAFEIPQSICHDVYSDERAWHGDFHGYVGYENDMPVSTTATVVAGDVIGVYSVATLPAHRKRGYAEFVMREAVNQATQETGIPQTALQSTRAGLSMYERMGYRKATSFSVYIF
jgi:GNAT superfamily N-acetyltransferase